MSDFEKWLETDEAKGLVNAFPKSISRSTGVNLRGVMTGRFLWLRLLFIPTRTEPTELLMRPWFATALLRHSVRIIVPTDIRARGSWTDVA